MEKLMTNINRKTVKNIFENNAIIILILIMALFVGFFKDNYFSWTNLVNLSVNTSARFIIALGVSGCLITKGTDLSAGRIVGLGACIAATLLQKTDYADKFFPGLGDIPLLQVILLTLVICAIIGFINGAVIAFLQVPPFIATLGMQTLVYGICLVYTRAEPIGALKNSYSQFATGKIFGKIPNMLVIAVICGVFVWFLYNKTRHGKYMYAIGGNENAAEVSGVNTTSVKLRIYTLAAILYGLAGILLCGKAGGASVNMGMGYELEAIAACTIGGVSTNGGVGKVSGILVGVLVFEILKISLQFLQVNPSYTYIVQGLVIIIAVALDLRKYLAKK
jgi:methyl-galactoside transport system permease protein